MYSFQIMWCSSSYSCGKFQMESDISSICTPYITISILFHKSTEQFIPNYIMNHTFTTYTSYSKNHIHSYFTLFSNQFFFLFCSWQGLFHFHTFSSNTCQRLFISSHFLLWTPPSISLRVTLSKFHLFFTLSYMKGYSFLWNF